MEDFNKTIIVNNNRIIKFYISEVYSIKYDDYIPKYIIEEYFIEKEEMYKSYRLSFDDKVTFTGWINAGLKEKESIKTLSFEFDSKHPLYSPLIHLLKRDKSLVINDDDTSKIRTKYMKISKNEEKISIDFKNNKKNDNTQDKFQITFKSITPNKKKYIDTKERLRILFKELINQMYQISIEEYLLNTIGIEDENVKIYMKTMIPKKAA